MPARERARQSCRPILSRRAGQTTPNPTPTQIRTLTLTLTLPRTPNPNPNPNLNPKPNPKPKPKPKPKPNPIKASWADAADGLLAQYREAIKANLPYRQELASYTHGFNQLARAALLCLFLWWLLKEYTIEISLLASRLLGVDLETLRGPEPRKRPPFWQPLKPFLRVLADALRRLGED